MPQPGDFAVLVSGLLLERRDRTRRRPSRLGCERGFDPVCLSDSTVGLRPPAAGRNAAVPQVLGVANSLAFRVGPERDPAEVMCRSHRFAAVVLPALLGELPEAAAVAESVLAVLTELVDVIARHRASVDLAGRISFDAGAHRPDLITRRRSVVFVLHRRRAGPAAPGGGPGARCGARGTTRRTKVRPVGRRTGCGSHSTGLRDEPQQRLRDGETYQFGIVQLRPGRAHSRAD